MSGILNQLPEGRRGQVIALALLAVAFGVLWIVLAAPLLDWHAERAEHLTERRLRLVHMQQIAATLPTLRQEVGKAGSNAPPATALLQGATDAIGGATLQSVMP